MDRRRFLLASSAVVAASAGLSACASAGLPMPGRGVRLDSDVAELQRRTFDWFVEVTDRERGLTPDRWPTESFCSVAAVGFALTCWPVGVENGWMTRDEARTRTLNTVRFFHDAPQGPAATGVAGHKGFFYHFLDRRTGHRHGRVELSTVDTALLLGGMLFAARFFDGDHADEAEIRRLSQAIYDRVEWDWVVIRPDRISMGWHPETGFIAADWNVYNEGMLVLLMAIGSTTHPVPATVWDEWCSVYDQSWSQTWGPAHLHFPPMFGHQYSHMFIDYRGIRDAWLRAKSAEIPGFRLFREQRPGGPGSARLRGRQPWAGGTAIRPTSGG